MSEKETVDFGQVETSEDERHCFSRYNKHSDTAIRSHDSQPIVRACGDVVKTPFKMVSVDLPNAPRSARNDIPRIHR